MARHYYDPYRLIGAGIGRKAAGDLELFERIVAHRQVCFRFTWMNYDTMHRGRLRLVPPNEHLSAPCSGRTEQDLEPRRRHL